MTSRTHTINKLWTKTPDRGWDGWMASPTQWTWVWINSGSWWWTGRPGMLQSTGLQRVRLSDWAELNTAKGFGIVNKTEVDIFLELSCFFDDPRDVGNLISGSSAFSKSSLNIWKFTVHTLLKPGLENFEHYFTSVRWVQLCSSLSILWHCFSLGLEWKLTFSSPVATAEFSKFAGILSVTVSQHHLLGFEIAKLEFHHLH